MKLRETEVSPNQDRSLYTLKFDGADSIRPGCIDHRDRAVDDRGLPDHERLGHHVYHALIRGDLIVQAVQQIPMAGFVPSEREHGLLDQQPLAYDLLPEEGNQAQDEIDSLSRQYNVI